MPNPTVLMVLPQAGMSDPDGGVNFQIIIYSVKYQ